jgi:hypothetical protein
MSAVTVERTGKPVKAVMLASALVSALAAVYAVFRPSVPVILASAAAFLVCAAAQVAAWWRHG